MNDKIIYIFGKDKVKKKLSNAIFGLLIIYIFGKDNVEEKKYIYIYMRA